MRQNESSKAVIFGNIDLNRYCNNAGISLNKLRNCNIEKMGDMYVFVLSKDHPYKNSDDLPLAHDIDTQPDIVLTMEYIANEGFKFETTKYTRRVLNTGV